MELPLFPLNTVLCPGHRPAPPHLRGPLPGAGPPLPRHDVAVRGRPDPPGPRGRDRRDLVHGHRDDRRDPRRRPLRRRPLRPPRRRDAAVRDPPRPERQAAVSGRRGRPPRRGGRRRGGRPSARDDGDPPVRHLPRAAPAALGRDGRRDRRPGRGRDRRRRGRRRDRGRRARTRRSRTGTASTPMRSARPRCPARATEARSTGRGVGRRTLRGPPAPGHDPGRPDGPVASARRDPPGRVAAPPGTARGRHDARSGCAACSA